MPISLPTTKIGKIVREDTILITEAKILRIDILVEGKAVVFVIGYGYTDEKGQFVVVERKSITVDKEAFIELSSLKVNPEDVGLVMYDLIGEKSYQYLIRKGLI